MTSLQGWACERQRAASGRIAFEWMEGRAELHVDGHLYSCMRNAFFTMPPAMTSSSTAMPAVVNASKITRVPMQKESCQYVEMMMVFVVVGVADDDHHLCHHHRYHQTTIKPNIAFKSSKAYNAVPSISAR